MHPNYTSKDVQRFWSKVRLPDLIGTDECWLWMACCTKLGYGRFYFCHEQMSAHRASYIFSIGPIPDDLFVLHHCDNPPCVNPAHLFLGTNADNVKDAINKSRWPVGDHHSQHRLTADQVIELRGRFLTDNITKKELAAEYGITDVMVGKIIRRERWKSI